MVRREVGQFVGERFFSQIPSTFFKSSKYVLSGYHTQGVSVYMYMKMHQHKVH